MKKILIAEDNGCIALEEKKTLSELGYIIIGVVSNGKDAIVMAKEKNPDLIIMDISLKGGMSGIEAGEEISAMMHVPILFVSGLLSGEVYNKYVKKYPDWFFVQKPYTREELLKAVSGIFNNSPAP